EGMNGKEDLQRDMACILVAGLLFLCGHIWLKIIRWISSKNTRTVKKYQHSILCQYIGINNLVDIIEEYNPIPELKHVMPNISCESGWEGKYTKGNHRLHCPDDRTDFILEIHGHSFYTKTHLEILEYFHDILEILNNVKNI